LVDDPAFDEAQSQRYLTQRHRGQASPKSPATGKWSRRSIMLVFLANTHGHMQVPLTFAMTSTITS
jgi:hypothetical protein